MRDKAKHGTQKVQRTLRNRSLRIGIGLTVLFTFGLMASGAFGDTFSVLTTSTDTTPASSAATTDTTSAPSSATSSTDTSSTDTSSSSTSTDSSAPAAGTVPYIATFKSGVSDAQQQDDIAAANGTAGDSIVPLHMYSLTFPAGEDSADAQTLAANADVASVTPDLSRDTATAPNDPRYSDQWSLPQIGWDNVFGSVDPGSGATVAVLDTGVDASQPDLQGAVVPGTDIVDGSGDGTSDPNGHGTEMAGIVAASTDNNVGIAGVGYSGVKVMPVTVLGADGTGLDSDVINGVVWATQHGANVILMSFSNPGYSPALQAAVNYAWSHGVVLVAAVGNDGSSTINYPAGDTGVVGVGSTGIGDAPSMFSNTGPDVFLAAPGEDILTTDTSGGYSSISGTSASAAEVAGAAALLKANSPMAGNGVIVNRLAESADAAGTPDQTGNGRLNLERAISDTNAASTEPAGAPGGGPFVGPYTIAAQLSGQLQTQNNPACSSGGICPWQTTNPTGWGELQTVPLRLLFAAGQSGLSNSFSISVDHSDGRTQGLDGLTNWSTSCSLSGITISGGVPTNGVTFASSTNGSGATTWTYTFTVTDNSSTACEIDFFTQLLAGSHQFTGTSLQIKGAGTIGFTKPTAAGGTADLSITKTALTAVSPGQVLTYNVAYSNGGTSTASGTQVTDVLPAGVTLVPASCSGTCSYDPLSREISWPIGTLASGGSGTKTYQVTVNPSDTDGTQLINNARIDSAVQDPNINNNQSQVTTTVKVPSISGSVIDDGTSGGLAGASVRLFTTTNCSGGSQVGSVITTDATGNWSFSGTGVTINTAYHVLRSNPTGYTSTSAVAGTGNLSSAVAQGNDCIQVTLGATGTYSSNNEFHASGVQNTTTAVTCTPSTVTYGGNTSCTATVTGATTGTISWSTDGSGSFSNSGTCSLSAGSCSITYTPNSVGTGTHKVTATYPSDSTHNGSNGSANVTVNPASLTVTPDSGQSKVYGTNDPTLTYTHGTLYNNDTNSVFSGSLTRDTGETVAGGPYAIHQGSLSAGSNYTIVFTSGVTFAITPRPATWTTNPNSKYWGQGQSPDPSPLTTGSGNFLPGDNVTASYSRDPGSSVGTYHIAATLSATPQSALDNYTITNTGNTFTINPDTTSLTLDSTTSGTDFGCSDHYTATLLDSLTQNGIAGVTLKLTIGSQFTTAVTDAMGVATFTLPLNQMITPPATSITVNESVAVISGLSATNYVSPTAPQPRVFTINANPNIGPYRAGSLYTGSRFFWTTSSTSSTATLTLAATIKDTGCGDPSIIGDVTKAKVSFQISSNDGTSWSPVSSGQNLPVGLVTPGDTTVGAASVISQYNIGKNQSAELLVKVTVGGEYTMTSDVFDVPITIAVPGVANELIGAGTLTNDGVTGLSISPPIPATPLSGSFLANGFFGAGDGLTSGGAKDGDVNISSAVVYSKSGTNPQGQVTLTIDSYNKPDGTTDGKRHLYFVKSNSIASLAFTGLPTSQAKTASFTAKTNVYDLTGTKVGLDGGGTMQLTITQPGGQYNVTSVGGNVTLTCPTSATNGCASVIVYKSTGGVWFSSAWGPVTSGAAPQTVEKLMQSGVMAMS